MNSIENFWGGYNPPNPPGSATEARYLTVWRQDSWKANVEVLFENVFHPGSLSNLTSLSVAVIK